MCSAELFRQIAFPNFLTAPPQQMFTPYFCFYNFESSRQYNVVGEWPPLALAPQDWSGLEFVRKYVVVS